MRTPEFYARTVFLDVHRSFNDVSSNLLILKDTYIRCLNELIGFGKFLTYKPDIISNDTILTARETDEELSPGIVLGSLLYII